MNTTRTRFYRDKVNGKFMGVCAGVADYTGVDVLWVRLGFLILACSMGWPFLIYFALGMLADKKPPHPPVQFPLPTDCWKGNTHVLANLDSGAFTLARWIDVGTAETTGLDGAARVVGQVACGFVYVDGSSVGDISEASLKDRRILGEEGFISCFIAVDLVAGKVVAGPEIHARGFSEDDDVFTAVLAELRQVVEAAVRNGIEDQYELAQLVRRTLGRWVSTALRRKPMIIPVVVEA